MNSSARPPGLRLDGRQRAEQVIGLELVVADHFPAEGPEERWRVGPLGLQLGWHRGPVGVVGGIELHPIPGGLGPEADHDGPRGVGLDGGQDEVAVPRRALTAWPSGPVIVLGRAKKAR